jgi:hypothetical protein
MLQLYDGCSALRQTEIAGRVLTGLQLIEKQSYNHLSSGFVLIGLCVPVPVTVKDGPNGSCVKNSLSRRCLCPCRGAAVGACATLY